VLPSGEKLTFVLLATITLEVVPFRTYALFPALPPFFMLEVVFCEGVQQHLQLCLDYLSCVKMAAFQSGKQKSHRGPIQVSTATVMLFFIKKFPGEKKKF
jgi:hypothetical protein